MALITTSTFDPLKARCNVRLQQGVPIVDADWNEMDDIRKFEMRAYLKWFVGDGIPEGSNAFAITAISAPVIDDFSIACGVGLIPVGASNYDLALRFSGRAIVNGLDVIIRTDTNYKTQPLFSAAAFGVPQIAAMPTAAGPMAVFLDIWERLVTSQEDPSLVLPGIGTESCARMKREWVVRTRSGSAVPAGADPDFIVNHSYYLLAVITRSAANAPISTTDIQDSRHLHLSMATIEGRLAFLEHLALAPTFNASPNQFNPKLGLPGSNITLFGTNLNVGSISVKFGGTAAAIVGNPTATQIVATVPAAVPGGVPITIQNGFGTVLSTDSFQILGPAPTLAPSPNQFNPKAGRAGTSVAITGINLNFSPVTVLIVGLPAIITANTGTQLTVTVPNVPLPGNVPIATSIVVVTANGQVVSTDQFTVTP